MRHEYCTNVCIGKASRKTVAPEKFNEIKGFNKGKNMNFLPETG